MVRTAVLVSGGGINLQSLIDANVFGEIPNFELAAVISTNPEAYALKRAEMAGINTYVIDREMFPSQTVFCFAVLDKLRDLDIELVVLAGYDCELGQPVFKYYEGKVIDTYPALLPSFTEPEDGDVQKEVLKAGVKLTGATAFFVDEKKRFGPIIMQKAVAVREGDTPAGLQRRVLEEGENFVLPRAVALYCQNRLNVENGVVHISNLASNDEKSSK